MKRISSQLPSYDSSYYLRLREWELNQMNNKVGAQSRIKDLRDDPLAAARSVRLQSAILRSDQFASNVDALRESLTNSEGQLRSAMDVLQRIRELAVQGANGIYDGSQLAYVGEEVVAEAPAADDESGTARLTLRMPERLKARVEEQAAREDVSTNAWLVRAVTRGLGHRRKVGNRLTGFAQS